MIQQERETKPETHFAFGPIADLLIFQEVLATLSTYGYVVEEWGCNVFEDGQKVIVYFSNGEGRMELQLKINPWPLL
jgi:hypothetical protein